MSNWEIYVKESYELIKRAENQLTVNLPHEIEAYVVHLFAQLIVWSGASLGGLAIVIMLTWVP